MTARSSRRRGRPAQTSRPARRALPWWLPVLLIVGAGTFAYANSFSSPFIFDDELAIERNPELHQWPDVARVLRSAPAESPLAGRPFVSLTFALNSAVGGLDVRGYRVANLAIHVACALLLFGLTKRTVAATPLAESAQAMALASSLVWVVHPLTSEVVDYLTQRTESTMALFALTTLYASVRARSAQHPWRWQTLAAGACALGMTCKETMVVVPVLVVLYDRVFVFASLGEAFRVRGRFYAALAAGWLVLAALMWSTPRTMGSGFASTHVSSWHYLLNQTVLITRYLRLTAWPRDLVLYYGWASPTTLAAVWPYAVFVVMLAAATIVALRRLPAAGFLGAWVFITLSPTSSVVPIGSEVGAERRMYLPLAALVVLLVLCARWLAGRWLPLAPRQRTVLAAVAVATCVAVLGWRTQARTREYASALTMARTVYERWPSGGAAHMLGTELGEAGYRDEAIAYLRQAAIDFAPAQLDLGVQLFKAGRYADAIDHLRRFIASEPNLVHTATAELLVAQALTLDGRSTEAIAHLQDMRMRRPQSTEAIGLLADAYFAQGAFDSAVREYRAFLSLHPDHPDAIANLAIAYVNSGRLNEAIEQFRRATEIQPGNVQAAHNLTRALLDRGDPADIEEAAARAAALVARLPNEAGPHSLQGLAFERQGRSAEARAAYQHALAIDPHHAPAREGLERLRRQP